VQTTADTGGDVVAALQRAGAGRGDLVALVVAPGVGAAMAVEGGAPPLALVGDATDLVRLVEDALRPRWVLWSGDTARGLVEAGVRLGRCWDIAAAHRLLFGGWRADPARIWAGLADLAPGTIPALRGPDLFSQAGEGDGDPEDPIGVDGHLRPEWVTGGWSATPPRLARWAATALTVMADQRRRLGGLADRPRASLTVRSESAAELLCAELTVEGLPMDRDQAEEVIARSIGRRPRDEAEAGARRARRDAEVLRHAPPGPAVDLRSPGQVRSLLARAGVDVVDTRAWRLRALPDPHPLVQAILAWRKVERIATTYGYRWLDEHLGADGRLRGDWTGCDGASGRMTASGGLHNMPADFRTAVVAEPGFVFVRADLGQIEPRVLAAVSGDGVLARASLAHDMYAPVAVQLGVDRAVAKVAVLGAMYGQTTGHGANALRGLKATYPVAMKYLDDADRCGRLGLDLRTYGGRLIPLGSKPAYGAVERAITPGQAAARGRYGRNALVQGAAAELFKMWAVTVRARVEHLGARIVLCLHDELLVHVPAEVGSTVGGLVDDCLQEAVQRWAPDAPVRFVAEISTIERWSDAKAPSGSIPNDLDG
jgi:DNA polymerase-1